MQNDPHIARAFDRDLESIQALVMKMGGMVETAILDAGRALDMPVPDPDAEGMRVMEWEMEPGDAVAFNYLTLHGARGNNSASRRRAFSLRLVGDDARYVERPGRTSPPYPGHQMQPGQVLREDWFPVLRQG